MSLLKKLCISACALMLSSVAFAETAASAGVPQSNAPIAAAATTNPSTTAPMCPLFKPTTVVSDDPVQQCLTGVDQNSASAPKARHACFKTNHHYCKTHKEQCKADRKAFKAYCQTNPTCCPKWKKHDQANKNHHGIGGNCKDGVVC